MIMGGFGIFEILINMNPQQVILILIPQTYIQQSKRFYAKFDKYSLMLTISRNNTG